MGTDFPYPKGNGKALPYCKLGLQCPSMEYKVINTSWSKRRKMEPPKPILDIQIIDFIKQHNHFCRLNVTYADGTVESLLSRVIYNPLKDHWTIDGLKVAIQLVDPP